MTLAARLWNILRSRIGARFGKPGDAGRDRAGRQHSTGPRHTGSTAGTGPRRPVDQDPVLARYYANLEVPYGSDLETVERAWKRLLRNYHPDRHATDPERQRIANDLVKQLNHAYAELRARLEKKSA